MSDLMSISEASRYSNVSGGHLTRLVKSGEIKGRKVGKFWVLEKESLDDWLRKRRGQSAAEDADKT